MVKIISDDSRHHAGGAIGRRSNHLPASCIFFVYRHGINAHPVVDCMRRRKVHAAFSHQGIMNTLGSAFNLQTAGQDTILGEAAIYTLGHDLPQTGNSAAHSILACTGDLIGTF